MNSHWHLTGNTLVTDRFIRLTSDAQSKAGGLWNTIPIPYPDWEIQVQFKIHGNNKLFYGDGFVIWYVRDPKLSGKKNLLDLYSIDKIFIGPVFGYQDHFHGLGIFLDTYGNNKNRHTVISFIFFK